MQQPWNASHYVQNAAFVPELGAYLIDVLDPKPGERVLDLGCGNGSLTRELVSRGAVVVGVDGSPEMVRAAQAAGLDAHLGDGMRLTFERIFDAVFSNAAIHWMPDHDAVFRSVARALRPGGRFVAECGGHGNVAAIATALRAVLGARGLRQSEPWTFAGPVETAARLQDAGFVIDDIQLVSRPTPLPGDFCAWLETFTGASLAQFNAIERARVIEEVTNLLAPALRDASGTWIADYVRLRWKAHLPGTAPAGKESP